MTSNDKQLLLVDLSARLPYNIAIDCRSEDSRFTCYLTTDMLREIQNNRCYWEYKPYLFPLSSMTEEQKKEEYEICKYYLNGYESKLIDFYHKNHLDYRGLISMGLANDATGLNIY
jgi:hypothetical protein